MVDAQFGMYNKGITKTNGVKEERWYVRSKAGVGPKEKRRHLFSYAPEFRNTPSYTGYFKSRDEAARFIPTFTRMVNGDRPQLPRAAAAKVVTDTAPTMPELDVLLKNSRRDAKQMGIAKRRQELYALLRKNSEVARELGWYEEGVRKGAKAKKKKVQRDDIFISKETRELCRVMKTTAEHKSFGDLKGTTTARPFISYDGDMAHHAPPLTSHGRADFEILECDYLYVRPSAIVTVTGALERAQGLRIALDPAVYVKSVVDLNLNLANWTDLYQDDEGLKQKLLH